jgi:cell division septal protein FtsQ
MSEAAPRRRRTLGTVALIVLIVAVPLGVFAWGRTAGTFKVRHIVVSGARPGHAKALRVVLRERFLGTNLFLATTARVRAALSGFPYVDQVSINRDFPNTLKVRMTEYVPAALLSSGGHWYVVSSEGHVLAEATGAASAGSSSSAAGPSSPAAGASPVVGASPSVGASPTTAETPAAGSSPTTTASPSGGAAASPPGQGSAATTPAPSSTSLPEPGAGVVLPRGARHLPVIATGVPVRVGGTVGDPHVRAALAVLAALPRPLRSGARGASATDTSIRLYVNGGPTIEFGDTSALAAKVLAVKAVLGRYRVRHVTCTFVDVSVPDRPLGAPLLPAPSTQTAAPTPTSSSSPTGTATSTPQNSPSGTPTSLP